MNSPASPPTLARVSSGTVLVHVDFLLTGIVMTFLGPMLPILSARWAITDAAAGRLFLTQFVSSMFGMLASSSLVERKGYRFTFLVGLLLMAAGMALLGSGPYWLGVLAVAVLGAGHGVTTPAGNLRTAEINPQRSASALNVINAVWGVGAMSSPFLLRAAKALHSPSWFLYGTAVALLVLMAGFMFARFESDSHVHAPTTAPAPESLWRSKMLPVICVLFFVYVGTEQSFGGWVATYAHRLRPENTSFWTVMPAFFYGALLAGRALAPIALRITRPTTVAITGLTLAFLGGLALIAAQGMALVAVGSSLAGAGLASIFPISVSLLPRWFGLAARRSSGAVFAGGNMGGAVLPWVVGVASTYSGSLRLALFVPLLGAAIMLAFYVINSRPSAVTAVPESPI